MSSYIEGHMSLDPRLTSDAMINSVSEETKFRDLMGPITEEDIAQLSTDMTVLETGETSFMQAYNAGIRQQEKQARREDISKKFTMVAVAMGGLGIIASRRGKTA